MMDILVKGAKWGFFFVFFLYSRQHTKPSSIVMGSLLKAHLFSNLAAEVDEMNRMAVDNNTVEEKRILKKNVY